MLQIHTADGPSRQMRLVAFACTSYKAQPTVVVVALASTDPLMRVTASMSQSLIVATVLPATCESSVFCSVRLFNLSFHICIIRINTVSLIYLTLYRLSSMYPFPVCFNLCAFCMLPSMAHNGSCLSPFAARVFHCRFVFGSLLRRALLSRVTLHIYGSPRFFRLFFVFIVFV